MKATQIRIQLLKYIVTTVFVFVMSSMAFKVETFSSQQIKKNKTELNGKLVQWGVSTIKTGEFIGYADAGEEVITTVQFDDYNQIIMSYSRK